MIRTAIQPLTEMHDRRGWRLLIAWAAVGLIGVPLFHLLPPEGAWYHIPAHVIPLLGKYLCFALVAVAMDLIWGYTGILSLGHSVFFALGGYMIARVRGPFPGG